MLLSQNSIIRFLPKELDTRQHLILDSIRFTIEMIDLSYNDLILNLERLSLNNSNRNIPQIFLNTWSMIDNTKRFIALFKKLPTNKDFNYIKKLEHAIDFRNTYQHLDERIDDVLLKNNKPFLGALSWEFKNIETNSVDAFIAISGLFYSNNHDFNVSEFDSLENQINNVKLESVNKKGKNVIDISNLYLTLGTVIELLEEGIELRLNSFNVEYKDWKKHRDILLIFKNKS